MTVIERIRTATHAARTLRATEVTVSVLDLEEIVNFVNAYAEAEHMERALVQLHNRLSSLHRRCSTYTHDPNETMDNG
jgi:hypothetical protein